MRSNLNNQNKSCFTFFKASIDSFSIPDKFTYPYNYIPHPLCELAVKELQDYIQTQKIWEYDFDIDNNKTESGLGKMFGVLLVQNSDNQIGYLSAFSGLLAGENFWPKFVPPVLDLLKKDSFHKQIEKEIEDLNYNIKYKENNAEFIEIGQLLNSKSEKFKQQLVILKKELKEAKKKRKTVREQKREKLNTLQFNDLEKELENQSRKDKYDFKVFKKSWILNNEDLQNDFDIYADEIKKLKKIRKQKSVNYQNMIFNGYHFLNQDGKVKDVCDVFVNTSQKVPPSGAGDCAAPKLLQYAFKNGLKPLAMAEFWWGQPSESEIRKHRAFYPACKGKCQPILNHMLEGLKIDPDPLLNISTEKMNIETIFEDEDILIINKPSGLLSAPGNISKDSVYKRIKEKYPDLNSPLIVHRLDMSTSGLMVIAKSDYAYKRLQSQFIKRTVKKRYVAVVDGQLTEDQGVISLPLKGDYNDRPRQLVCYENGKEAITRWKLIESYYGKNGSRTKILFIPVTGRTHQLRVHAAHFKGLNCPIAGDELYGKADGSRLCLHAEWIEFKHPVNNEVISFHVDENF